jgi:hypothetical protein
MSSFYYTQPVQVFMLCFVHFVYILYSSVIIIIIIIIIIILS